MSSSASKHVVVVLVGNASWTDGYETPGTFPNWDVLTSLGTKLTSWISNPIGSHSMYELLFGEYPFRNGNHSGFSWYQANGPSNYATPALGLGKRSLASKMRLSGKTTALFGKWNVGRHEDDLQPLKGQRNGYTPYLFGFDQWRAGIASNVNSPPSVPNPGSGYEDWQRWDGAANSMSTDWCDEAIGDEWVSWFDALSQDSFSVVSFAAGHGPLVGSPPASSLPPMYPSLPTKEAYLVAADHQLGKILQRLDFSKDRLLFFSSTGAGAKGVLDSRVLCPAAVAGSWAPTDPGGSSSYLSTPRDAAPMICPGSLFFGPDVQRPSLYIYLEWQDNRAVRTDNYKLVQLPNGTQQLFDLCQDPNELTPIDPSVHPDQSLVSQLQAWMANP